MPENRPLTQREILKNKKSKASEPQVTVTNRTKRMLTIQLRDVDSDFYVSERSIYINPGKSYTDRHSIFNENQLSNLKAKGEISVIGA